jgi:hypothetical protein
MITKEAARRQVQSELQSLKLQKPLSDWDVSIFCCANGAQIAVQISRQQQIQGNLRLGARVATSDVSVAAALNSL